MAVHHGSREDEFVFPEEEHAEGRIFGENRHDDDRAAFLRTFHQRADGRLHAGDLEPHLKTFVAENRFHALFQRGFRHVEGVGDARTGGRFPAR